MNTLTLLIERCFLKLRSCFVLVQAVGLALVCASPLPVFAQTGSDKPERNSDVPDYETLIQTLNHGSKFERGPAAAWLCEYPDRLEDFTEDAADLFITPDASMNRVASDLFQYFGEKAIPPALSLFDPDAVTTPEGEARWRKVCGIIHALGETGREPFEAKLVEVLKEYDDVNVRVPAIYALTGLANGSPEAIPLILGDVNHENFNVGLPALRLIANTGPEAAEALQVVRGIFADGNLSQRTYAAMALGGIGPVEGYDPLDDLEPKLDEFFLAVRQRSLIGIGLMGVHAQRLEPKVIEIMNEDNSNLEAVAAFVLWQITGEADQAVARLVELSVRPEFEISAIEFLGQIGPAANGAVKTLRTRLKSSDKSIRAYALDALAKICPEDEVFLKELTTCADGKTSPLRLTAKRILRTVNDSGSAPDAEPQSDRDNEENL